MVASHGALQGLALTLEHLAVYSACHGSSAGLLRGPTVAVVTLRAGGGLSEQAWSERFLRSF